MTTVTATTPVRDWLSGLTGATEILDPEGNLIGHFKPKAEVEAEIYERAKLLFDPEEIERIAATEGGKGRPLAEFWKELQAREAPR